MSCSTILGISTCIVFSLIHVGIWNDIDLFFLCVFGHPTTTAYELQFVLNNITENKEEENRGL